MKGVTCFIFATEDFAFNVEQEFAGQAVFKALRARHALEDAVDKQIDSSLVKLICDVAKFVNLALKTVLDCCNLVSLKSLAEFGAEIGEMALKRSIVIPGAPPEGCQRRRGRFLERLVQLLSSLVHIEGGAFPNPDGPPVRYAEHVERPN